MITISHKSNLIAALATERDRFFDELSKVGADTTATQQELMFHNVEVTGSPALSASPRGLPG